MLLTKASEYALLSLIFLAKAKGPQDVETISTKLNISKSFLAKILQGLARSGILVSFKGAKGGFSLARPCEQINIKDILQGAEKKPTSVFDCAIEPYNCPKNEANLCEIWPFFARFQKHLDDYLENMTLHDLLNQ